MKSDLARRKYALTTFSHVIKSQERQYGLFIMSTWARWLLMSGKCQVSAKAKKWRKKIKNLVVKGLSWFEMSSKETKLIQMQVSQ